MATSKKKPTPPTTAPIANAAPKLKHKFFTGTTPDSGTMPHDPVKVIGVTSDGQRVFAQPGS